MRSILMLALVSAVGACTTTAPRAVLHGSTVFPPASPSAESKASVGGEHGERPASRPFRMRRASTLREGEVYSQTRVQTGAENSALQASFDYGISDALMLGVFVGSGHDLTTISLADKPGRLLDFGAQYCFYGEEGGPRLSARFDLVLANKTAFEPGADPDPFAEDRAGSSKISYQPSLLASFPVGDEGISIYSSAGVRLGDRTEPTIALAAGIRVPLAFAGFVTEIDWARQSLDGGRINETYLTPGLEWTVREKLFIAVGTSIGLTRTSEDWMASLTMGVRF